MHEIVDGAERKQVFARLATWPRARGRFVNAATA